MLDVLPVHEHGHLILARDAVRAPKRVRLVLAHVVHVRPALPTDARHPLLRRDTGVPVVLVRERDVRPELRAHLVHLVIPRGRPGASFRRLQTQPLTMLVIRVDGSDVGRTLLHSHQRGVDFVRDCDWDDVKVHGNPIEDSRLPQEAVEPAQVLRAGLQVAVPAFRTRGFGLVWFHRGGGLYGS